MRDLGKLGEYTFASWCAQVGLIANGSMIDKTGWDFYVEFPISQDISTNELHKSAVNCKVQVKATDNREGKWQVTLSNLRQMATSQMPSFYVFLEFDSKSEVQRAYIVHVDNEYVYKILKRIREIEQKGSVTELNKKKMTIYYNEENEIKFLNGRDLQAALLKYIGENYIEYVENKNNYLKECGFEKGYGKVEFSIAGGDLGLHQLIDLSLGLTDEIDVENFVNIDERFGISSKNPSFQLDTAKLKMGVLPSKKGKLTLKEDNLSRSLTFDIKFYNSPFSFYDYRKYTKFRVVGDFFDMTCEPYAGKVNYNLTLDEDTRLELKKLRDALDFIRLISADNQKAIVELKLENLDPLVFDLKSKFVKRDIKIFNEIIGNVLKICYKFEIDEEIYVSLNELYYHKKKIEQFYAITTKTDDCEFRAEFEISCEQLFESEQVASISVFCCQLGTCILGTIITLFGKPEKVSKNKFRINNTALKIEKVFTYRSDSLVTNDEISKFIECISSKYEHEYDVFYNWGR